MENYKPINIFAMQKQNQPREINFEPNKSSFSGVTDLKSIFTDDEPIDNSVPEKLGDLFEEVKEVEDIRTDKEKESKKLLEVIKSSDEDLEKEKEEEEVEKPTLEFEGSDDYKEITKELFGDSFDTIIIEENGVEVEKSLDDMDLDKETFLDLVKSHIESVKKSASDNKIETTDLSERTKRIIEIDKNGGNVTEALQVYKEYQDPFTSLDLTERDDQIKAIVHSERLLGETDEAISKKLRFYDFDKSIEEEAYRAKERIDKLTTDKVNKLEQEAIKQKEFEKEALKKYRGDLSTSLDSFELKPSYKKRLLDISSKKNENGHFELDDIYSKVRANPSESADLILFLTNKEEYLKQKMKVSTIAKQVETQQKLRLTRRGRADVNIKPSSKTSDYIDIENLPR